MSTTSTLTSFQQTEVIIILGTCRSHTVRDLANMEADQEQKFPSHLKTGSQKNRCESVFHISDLLCSLDIWPDGLFKLFSSNHWHIVFQENKVNKRSCFATFKVCSISITICLDLQSGYLISRPRL